MVPKFPVVRAAPGRRVRHGFCWSGKDAAFGRCQAHGNRLTPRAKKYLALTPRTHKFGAGLPPLLCVRPARPGNARQLSLVLKRSAPGRGRHRIPNEVFLNADIHDRHRVWSARSDTRGSKHGAALSIVESLAIEDALHTSFNARRASCRLLRRPATTAFLSCPTIAAPCSPRR